MTLALSQVRDIDCVASTSPLAFDIGTAYVTGAAAILRRCLYSICERRGTLVWSDDALGEGLSIFDLQNASLTTSGIDSWKRAIARQIKHVDFVFDATAGLALYLDTWILVASIVLVDGRTYPLEVSIGDASAAINGLGTP